MDELDYGRKAIEDEYRKKQSLYMILFSFSAEEPPKYATDKGYNYMVNAIQWYHRRIMYTRS